ncbi:MAG: hypothetical protein HC905_24810 [Bacteroidales bacterium]|nr:hypothetical protein [Bacteroidales bacterium]
MIAESHRDDIMVAFSAGEKMILNIMSSLQDLVTTAIVPYYHNIVPTELLAFRSSKSPFSPPLCYNYDEEKIKYRKNWLPV